MNDVPAPSSVYFVIAAYNEGQAIGEVVRTCLAHYPHVVVVDDGSRDETLDAAVAAGAIGLRHVTNLGQGAALQTGIDYALKAGASHIVTFDADGQHRIEDVAPMLEALVAAKAEICLGSRFLGDAVGMSGMRRMVLKAAILFTWVTSGIRLTDAHNGLRVMTANAARTIRIRQNRMAHASEIIDEIARHRIPYIEHPVTIVYTEYSRAKGQRISNMINIVVELFMGRLFR